MRIGNSYQGGEREEGNLEERIEERIEKKRRDKEDKEKTGYGLRSEPSSEPSSELRYQKGRNFLDYALPFSYQERWEQERRDILKFIPATTMNRFPVQGNEWLYGWTIRGTNTVNIRDDLQGWKKLETDIHECTHTPDEYETRRRTEWKLQARQPEEEKYEKKKDGYKR